MTGDLQGLIERAWDERESIGPGTKGAVRQAVDTAIAALDSGEARIAEKLDGTWAVHQWLKKSVLLSFRLNPILSVVPTAKCREPSRFVRHGKQRTSLPSGTAPLDEQDRSGNVAELTVVMHKAAVANVPIFDELKTSATT